MVYATGSPADLTHIFGGRLCLDLDQSIGVTARRGATVGAKRDLIGARLLNGRTHHSIVRHL